MVHLPWMHTKKENASRAERAAQLLGEAFQDERLRMGISQERLALRVGMGRAHYARLERGERQMPVALLLRIATVLECSSASLIKMVEMDLGRLVEKSELD